MQLRNAAVVVGTLFTVSAQAQRAPAPVGQAEIALYGRLMAMADTRTLDLTVVDQALASRWKALRAASALAIGQVGSEVGKSGAGRLRALLTDVDATVAANAAYSLGLLRDTASIPDLRRGLSSRLEVAREAAWALGEIGSAAASAIADGLKSSVDDGTRIQLLLAESKLRPISIPAIRPFLRAPNPSVVWAAAYAIARTRAPAGVRDLLELGTSTPSRTQAIPPRSTWSVPYNDPRDAWNRTRAEIARALAKAAAGDSLGPRAYETLLRLARDPDPHVRVNAVRSLGTYGQQAREAVAAATRDRDASVRVAAAQSLGTVLHAGDDLAALWSADTSIVYRTSVLASVTRAGIRPPELRQWLTSPDWRLRAAVANAAGDTLDRAFAIARVTPLIRDPDPRVREFAYGALVPTASMSLEDSVHGMLITGLSDPDFYVRATVLGALADRPTAADLPAVLDSYVRAARDSGNDARLAAIQYVGALWKKDSASLNAPLLSRLRSISAPSDPLERASAKNISPWSSWRSIPTRPRLPGYYDAIVKNMVVPTLRGRPPIATIHTVRGPIRIEFFAAEAPITVANFLSLANSGFYRNTRFHRVVPNFVAQDGDPRDDGNGGPGYAIRDEMNRHRYERGAVGMALSGPDTGGSQYFITHSPQPHLDGHYTVFGRVISGYDALDKIVQGDLITRVESK